MEPSAQWAAAASARLCTQRTTDKSEYNQATRTRLATQRHKAHALCLLILSWISSTERRSRLQVPRIIACKVQSRIPKRATLHTLTVSRSTIDRNAHNGGIL